MSAVVDTKLDEASLDSVCTWEQPGATLVTNPHASGTKEVFGWYLLQKLIFHLIPSQLGWRPWKMLPLGRAPFRNPELSI